MENKDLERYLNEGRLPPCAHCNKKDGVKAKLNHWYNDYYLEWLCEDCLDCGEHIMTKEAVCINCKKHFRRKNIYIGDTVIMFCSKKCLKDGDESEDDLDNYIHITKDYVCPNCNKPFNLDDLYYLNENVYCSKECAVEYEGYHDMDYWEKKAGEFKDIFGKGICIS